MLGCVRCCGAERNSHEPALHHFLIDARAQLSPCLITQLDNCHHLSRLPSSKPSPLYPVAVGLNCLKFSVGIKIRPGTTRPRKALQRGLLPMDEQGFMLKSLSNSEEHPVSIRQCELTLSPRQGSMLIHSSTISKCVATELMNIVVLAPSLHPIGTAGAQNSHRLASGSDCSCRPQSPVC